MKYTNQDIEYNANIPEFRQKPAGFCYQLNSQLYRNFLPIFRNKTLFILELGGALFFSYIFTVFFKDVFIDNGTLDDKDGETLFLFGVNIVFGYIIYLGGFPFDKIKERNTKTKHLLYLSGCNMWSYWGGFL